MRSTLFLKTCGILIGLVMLAACDNYTYPGISYSNTIAEGRAAVKEVMAESGATSVSVALVDGDRVIWSEAIGTADREAGRNVETTTLYSICSTSKMLGAIATMILVDRGQVSLNEPVSTYVKNFAMPLDERYRNITVRMLLNHTSGLSGNDMRGVLTVDPFPGYAAQMMESFAYQRLKHDPGSVAAYNNDGFTMIQNLVKSVTGQEYIDFVRQNILTPLDMKASRYQTGPFPEDSYARPYSGSTRLPLFFINTYGSGGLSSTPVELSHVAQMFINKGVYGSRRVLSEQSVATMAQDQRQGTFNPVPYENFRYGLGWDTMAQPGLAAVGVAAWQKTGDMNGNYGINILVAPEEKLGVVVFGASNKFSSEYAVKVSERILLRALAERGRIAAMPAKLSSAALPLKAVTADEKSTYAGYYASSSSLFHLKFNADDSLTVDELGMNWTPKFSNFRLRSDGWYAADNDPVTAVRLLSAGERAYFAYRQTDGFGHYSKTVMYGQRLDDRPALTAAWQARLKETWLPVNTDTRNLLTSKGNPGFQLTPVAAPAGYLIGNNILRDVPRPSDDRLDGMFLFMADGIKDLQDMGMESWSGQSWLRHGSYLYRPLTGLPLLVAGPVSIAIGSNGFNEWRQLPASGKLNISGATNWFLYDADFNELASGTTGGAASFSGTRANYLALFGSSGAAISLNLTTP